MQDVDENVSKLLKISETYSTILTNIITNISLDKCAGWLTNYEVYATLKVDYHRDQRKKKSQLPTNMTIIQSQVRNANNNIFSNSR